MAHVGCPACGKTVADTDATCKWCNADIAASRQAAVAAAAIDELSLVQTMSDAQRQLFYAEMAQHRKEKGVARILALLLGGVGGQFFYLRSYAAGAVCILFVGRGSQPFGASSTSSWSARVLIASTSNRRSSSRHESE